MNADVLAFANDLSRRGRPFVLATVVWRRAPSSGKEGSTALITADRRVHGWLGGACAEPTVIGEALRALEEGTPRLLFLGPPEELAARAREGVVTVPIACQSEGALEVYVEPVLPQPHLVVIGRSPAVGTLASMAGALGWRTVVVDEGGLAEDYPGADRVLTSLELADADVTDRSVIVVATQGHYDEAALEAALATPAAYVGLVASRRRADAVLGYLRDRGASDDAARPRPRAGRSGPGQDRARGDRRRDPRRARPGAGRRQPGRGDAGGGPDARGDRPGVRHDGGRRVGRVPVDLRGHDLLLLFRGLPDAVRGGPGEVRGGRSGYLRMRDTRPGGRGGGPKEGRRPMDEATTGDRTLSDEDILTVSPAASAAETEQPKKDDTDSQDADGRDGDATDQQDGDAKDQHDADGTDKHDSDTTDSKDSDGTDAPS